LSTTLLTVTTQHKTKLINFCVKSEHDTGSFLYCVFINHIIVT